MNGMGKVMNYSEVMIGLHTLARQEHEDNPDIAMKLRFLADEVAKLGNESHMNSLAKEVAQLS